MLVVGNKHDAKSEGVEVARKTGVLARILSKRRRNTCGTRRTETRNMSSGCGATNSTAFPLKNPATPYMSNECSRVLSFRCGETWQPGRISATPEQLAKAGFFYMGESDRVKCWYCNGALESWDYDDDPWIEHAKWYPSCEFTLRRKGTEFVSDVVSQFSGLTRPDPSKVRSATSYVPVARSSLPPTSRTHPDIIDPKEEQRRTELLIQSKMESCCHVQQAKEIGFLDEKIREALRKQYQVKNRNFGSLDELLETLNEVNTASSGASCSHNHRAPVDTTHQTISNLENGKDEDRKCKICFDHNANVVFVPCGHLSTCEQCAQKVTTCPMCRSYVREKIKTYIS